MKKPNRQAPTATMSGLEKMLNFSSFCDSDYSWYKIVNALLILKSIFVISPLSSLLLFTSVYLDLCG